jgi:tRNA-specific 2-thiouridylase
MAAPFDLPPLDLPRPPKDCRVVVAMSGGVDSATTAALMVEAGCDVVGITLQLYDHGAATGKAHSCCAGQDIHDATRVAERLGIPHYVLDYETRFRRDVIDTFADAYAKGETPIPCIACNRTVKFRDLLTMAKELGADALATGHYVRRIAGPQGAELHRAVDDTRDQSYFLFATTRDQLDYLRFPLGGMSKDETRALAQRFDLPVAAKPDSQDICFVPTGSYGDLVAKLRPEANAPGEIVDGEGQVLGRHDGIIHFTVGQRKGLGVASGEPLYVLRLDAPAKRVIVGSRAALGQQRVVLREVNWLGSRPDADIPVTVKLRSAQPPQAATLSLDDSGGGIALLDEPVLGVAPGQACVVYDGSRVLGGGWIARETREANSAAVLAAALPLPQPG